MIPENDERRRLEQLLGEDAFSAEETQALVPLLSRLRRGPPADGGGKARLLQALSAEMAARRPVPGERHDTWWPLRLLQGQVRVVQREVLLASALILVLGALVTLSTRAPSQSLGTLPIVLLAPLAAAAGTALIDNDLGLNGIDPLHPIRIEAIAVTKVFSIYGFDIKTLFSMD